MTSLLAARVCLFPCGAGATTTTITIAPDSSQTADSWIREENNNNNNTNNGTDNSLKLRASMDASNRNIILRMPLTGIPGRTVLQAWLDLKQTSGTPSPIDARIFPLTGSFGETFVTWTIRDRTTLSGTATNTPWAMPGGTHATAWTDRQVISTTTDERSVRFQVGPIVQAWNSGALANNGFVIEPVRPAPSRELTFDSSDRSGAGHKPSLIIQLTDSPPAIARGTGEIQPRTVHANGATVALTAWLDVDATSATPPDSSIAGSPRPRCAWEWTMASSPQAPGSRYTE